MHVRPINVAEGRRERCQFTWSGKREAKAEARRPVAWTMRPCKEKSDFRDHPLAAIPTRTDGELRQVVSRFSIFV